MASTMDLDRAKRESIGMFFALQSAVRSWRVASREHKARHEVADSGDTRAIAAIASRLSQTSNEVKSVADRLEAIEKALVALAPPIPIPSQREAGPDPDKDTEELKVMTP